MQCQSSWDVLGSRTNRALFFETVGGKTCFVFQVQISAEWFPVSSSPTPNHVQSIHAAANNSEHATKEMIFLTLWPCNIFLHSKRYSIQKSHSQCHDSYLSLGEVFDSLNGDGTKRSQKIAESGMRRVLHLIFRART